MGWTMFALCFLCAAVVLFVIGWRKGQKTEAYDSVLWLLAGVVMLGLAALVGIGGLLAGAGS